MKLQEFLELSEGYLGEWSFQKAYGKEEPITIIATSDDAQMQGDFVPLIEIYAVHRIHGKSYQSIGAKHLIHYKQLSKAVLVNIEGKAISETLRSKIYYELR